MDEPRKRYSKAHEYTIKGEALKQYAYKIGISKKSPAPIADLDAMVGREKFRQIRTTIFKTL